MKASDGSWKGLNVGRTPKGPGDACEKFGKTWKRWHLLSLSPGDTENMRGLRLLLCPAQEKEWEEWEQRDAFGRRARASHNCPYLLCTIKGQRANAGIVFKVEETHQWTAYEGVPLITGYSLDMAVPGEQHRELAGASGAWSSGATCPTHPQPPRNGHTPLHWASISWGLAAAVSNSQPQVA